jgi:hypothetical protein
MIKKVMQKRPINESQTKDDLVYWLSRPPEERVAAVGMLRRQFYGKNMPRMKKVFRIIPLSRDV